MDAVVGTYFAFGASLGICDDSAHITIFFKLVFITIDVINAPKRFGETAIQLAYKED